MVGYQHPCRYCQQLVPPDAATCPYCSKVNPTGSLRCPKCKSPVQSQWKSCTCGQPLEITCPSCFQQTFFGDYCQKCDQRLLITCPKCKTAQPPLGGNCIKCKKPLSWR
jgi:hypothetical protein